ncbi:hypothetical protein [Pseudonocardia humida]|uniref:hypothetical protein n=1 Tax=Pseudonocardia humida TaxID=2800819 RepID=UPI00207CCF05|nr:hypothetical protein [Pseudonocardia humida]
MLVAAVDRPGGLPEAVVAVPAAGPAVVAGLVGADVALAEIVELAPTVGFLAAVPRPGPTWTACSGGSAAR